MMTMSEEVYVDILTRVQVAAAQMDGEQKEFYDEIINEISSLRNALQIFSDEFDKIQQQDEARGQMDLGTPYPVQ
jgi:ATP-dependent Clp protease ATP-binding subunit ClpA